MEEAEGGLRGHGSRAWLQKFRLAFEAITEQKYLSYKILSLSQNTKQAILRWLQYIKL